MKIYDSLPHEIITKAGHIYKRINLPYPDSMKKAYEEKKKYLKIGVLSKSLRGKTDIHGNLYKPSTWIFEQDHEIPNANVITLDRAQYLASTWHGGQCSALYQFASSHTYITENHLHYLEEIEQGLMEPETALKPFFRSEKHMAELRAMKNFFIAQGLKHGLRTVYNKDKYGYPIASLHPSVPEEIQKQIKPIKRMQ